MAYTAKTWVDNSAPSVCAANLNDLETGVADAHTTADRAVAKGVLQAKGDLFAALSASSPTRVVVGADNTVLVADSAQTHGLKWVQIGNAQVLAAAAIAYSKLNLAGSIVNADVGAGAAIAYSKLALASSIVNADIASSASISAPKIAGFPSDSAKFLRGDATWAAPSAAEYDVLSKITTAVSVCNTTTQTDLVSYSVGASVLGTDKRLHLVAGGDYLNNTGDTLTVRLKLGAETLWASDAFAHGASATRRAWHFEATIHALASATAQRGTGTLFFSGVTAPGTGTGTVENMGIGTHFQGAFLTAAGTVDTAVAQTLALTAQHGAASANLEIKMYYADVEVIG